MTFASEELRHIFHQLPTQKQYEWVSLDEYLAQSGKLLHIEQLCAGVDEYSLRCTVHDTLTENRSA